MVGDFGVLILHDHRAADGGVGKNHPGLAVRAVDGDESAVQPVGGDLDANLHVRSHGEQLAVGGRAATMLTADNADLHAKLTAAILADNASKTAHTALNHSIAGTKKNARLLAQRIKKSTAYTEEDGKKLNIIGAEDSTDMTQEQPTLYATAKGAGVVEIDFNKIDAEGVHIYGQRDGESAFTLLASETHAAYLDNRPLLAAGKPETR